MYYVRVSHETREKHLAARKTGGTSTDNASGAAAPSARIANSHVSPLRAACVAPSPPSTFSQPMQPTSPRSSKHSSTPRLAHQRKPRLAHQRKPPSRRTASPSSSGGAARGGACAPKTYTHLPCLRPTPGSRVRRAAPRAPRLPSGLSARAPDRLEPPAGAHGVNAERCRMR